MLGTGIQVFLKEDKTLWGLARSEPREPQLQAVLAPFRASGHRLCSCCSPPGSAFPVSFTMFAPQHPLGLGSSHFPEEAVPIPP